MQKKQPRNDRSGGRSTEIHYLNNSNKILYYRYKYFIQKRNVSKGILIAQCEIKSKSSAM